MDWEHFITHYGYWVILLGAFFEGETVLLIGGILAYEGHLSLGAVMATATVGSFAGDQLWYYVGHRGGPPLLERWPTLRATARRARWLLKRYGTLFVFGFRFLYGIRTVTPFLLGAIAYPRLRYFALNLGGAVVWGIVGAYLGWLFGEAVAAFFEDSGPWVLVGAIVLLIAAGFSFRLLRRRPSREERRRRRAEP